MVSPRPASCSLRPTVLVFQLLPSTAAELEGAVETQSLVGINKLMQFVEAEPVTLGMEVVILYHVFSVASSYVAPPPPIGGPRCSSQSGLTSLQAHRTALLKQLVTGEATQDMS